MDFDRFVPGKPTITIKKQNWHQRVPCAGSHPVLITGALASFLSLWGLCLS